MSFAVMQKFEVLYTTYPRYKSKFVLIIQPCPEEGGENYFLTNSIYNMIVTINPPHYGFFIQNFYGKEKLPQMALLKKLVITPVDMAIMLSLIMDTVMKLCMPICTA